MSTVPDVLARRIVLMGPPGAGKGTQASRLASRTGLVAISTGDIFRDNVRRKTALGKQVSSILATGAYVPDAITNAMVRERLGEPDALEGFILDGYPRTTDQVAELDQILAGTSSSVDVVVLLEAKSGDLLTRLAARASTENRTDDEPGVVLHRVEVYRSETAPLIDVYSARGLLVRVDGTGTPDDVTARLNMAVGQ